MNFGWLSSVVAVLSFFAVFEAIFLHSTSVRLLTRCTEPFFFHPYFPSIASAFQFGWWQRVNRRHPEYLAAPQAGSQRRPGRLTLSIFRRVFAAVLAFVFFPHTGKFHQGKDHPDVNPYFPWGHEIPSGSIFWAEAESRGPVRPPFLQVELFYFLNYENRCTYLYILTY